MKTTIICEASRDGFCGYLYDPPSPTGRCMLVIIGDDGNDSMDRACARWLIKYQGISALCLALRQDPAAEPGLSLWNLNTIDAAVSWLHNRGICKIGICGVSMQAVVALSAAARIPGISLVLAFSPCDYVPWGFRRGEMNGSRNAEYPTGKSLLTWKGQPLPFQSANLSKEDYWKRYQKDSKTFHEMHSRGVFDYSEQLSPIAPEAFIPAEKIRGAVVLVGAEDDSMWNSTRYIHRLRKRLREQEFMFPVKAFTYSCGTHLILPQRMVMGVVPVLGNLISLLYSSGRRHPLKCRAARISLDNNLTTFLQSW